MEVGVFEAEPVPVAHVTAEDSAVQLGHVGEAGTAGKVCDVLCELDLAPGGHESTGGDSEGYCPRHAECPVSYSLTVLRGKFCVHWALRGYLVTGGMMTIW